LILDSDLERHTTRLSLMHFYYQILHNTNEDKWRYVLYMATKNRNNNRTTKSETLSKYAQNIKLSFCL